MRSNNQTLERYNPAKEDKKKLKGLSSPTGKTVRVDERTEIVVPADCYGPDLEYRIERAKQRIAASKKIEVSTGYKSKKANEKLLRP